MGSSELITDGLLRSGKWFSRLPKDIQAAMLTSGRMRQLVHREVLFEQESEASGLHAVIDGEIRIHRLVRNGSQFMMGIIRPGEWTGFLSCLDGLPHSYAGIGQRATKVFTIPRESVLRIFERDVATFRLLLEPELVISRKLSRHLTDVSTRSLAQRVASRLSELGRWAYSEDEGPITPLKQVSQEELAASVGATRQRVNAILRDFQSREFLKLGYGSIVILNAEALESFASAD